ncbi:sensor histidine kinase [Paenibacillus antri]|uniref:histidine kinase n=1 Tax=Paenibacillus antri TaxID=2582848 RepID=A0A5R9GEC7_9BACL|nr:ATP-binding protein [Paenibacillus antri]TLS51564.1 sensor histidine kinase [Paenibacillus antri]
MTYRTLKLFTILLPPVIIGGFEFIRHDWLISHLSMDMGNVYITALTLLLSYLFATWMFKKIERMNRRLAAAEAERAVFEERERLASELHDNIAQTLFFLNVKLKKGEWAEAESAVAEIDRNVRQAIFNLRSKPDEAGSLAARLRKWLSEWQTASGVDVDLELRIEEQYFTVAEEVLLFGIVQEALTNIRKHSNATKTDIRFVTAPNEWRLTIRDNGTGMRQAPRTENTYGLSLMSDRVRNVGASLEIESLDGQGTNITVRGRKGAAGR